ncbi:Retrovirus-related Pol Polyprotein from transposon TNT 1-94 [Phytophthora megakarya]|uniref:Retrovirus-related Pol Polyprotein from transposon TNT 1-94 n=1 Tax=Phytophthora megakarya TaxID=4795 RepID=A0A225VJR6_9STRA|nr:Retrovirus-related Pol Polyprotein from transposon TNT 1-94 [Phytophthora megakarya]
MSFNGSNYTAWKMRVKSRLEVRDLWNIVTLRERPPRRGLIREQEFWRCEKATKAFLLETLTDDLVVSFGVKRYAFVVFEHLEQTYGPKIWGNLVALREQFISLKYTEGDEMAVQLNKLKTLAEKQGRQSKPVDDKEKVCPLL